MYDKRMGTSEMIFLFFLVLILFGPKKLPEIAREVGKLMAEFKRASNDFKQQLTQEIDKSEQASQPSLSTMAQTPATEAPKSTSFTQSLLPAGVKTAISEIDTAHDRLMKTAKLAFEAQNFTLRPPDAPTVAVDDSAAPAPEAPVTEAATPAVAEAQTPETPEAAKPAGSSPVQQDS